jgi:hypothetical protein
MPQYSFVTTHNGKTVELDEPIDLPDVKAAWEEATVYAGQMLKDVDGSLGSNTEWSVDVREQGRSVRKIHITTEGEK